MEGKKYLFFPQDFSNRFWQLDNQRRLFNSANTYYLHSDPGGWMEMAIENNRNDKYFGIDRSVSIPLTFNKDGKLIICSLWDQFGHEADFYLRVVQQFLNFQPGKGYSYDYRQIFRGQGNFATYKHVGPRVSLQLVEDGLTKHIKANESTLYSIPMNVPEAIRVKHDGIELFEKSNFAFADGVNYVNFRYVPAFEFLGNEGDNYKITQISEIYEIIPGTAGADEDYVRNSDNYFYFNENATAVDITIKGKIKIKCNRNDTAPLSSTRLLIKTNRDNGSGGTIEYTLFNATPTGGSQNIFDINTTITVNPGEKLFMFGRTISVNDQLYNFEFLPESNLSVTFVTRRPPTYTLHLEPQYIYNYLINKITDGEYSAEISNLLTQYKNIPFTCGDAIRQIKDANDVENAEMKISLKIFFEFWDYNFNIGLQEMPGQKVKLEIKEDLIDTSNIIDLGEPYGVPSFDCDEKPLFNELEIGYPEISNEIGILNGRQEYNCKTNRTIGTVIHPAKLSLISPVKTSCYEEEKIRTTLIYKQTTDNKTDNDVYANHIETVLQPEAGIIPAHYKFDRTLNATVTSGLLAPNSVWNLFLRPTLMLYRNGSRIRSSLFRCENRIFKEFTAEKNKDVVCDGITDKDDIVVGSLKAPYIIPYTVTSNFAAPEDLISNLDINPLQVFQFTLENRNYKCLGRTIKSASEAQRLQNYEMVFLAGQDTSQLKYYEGI